MDYQPAILVLKKERKAKKELLDQSGMRKKARQETKNIER